MEENVCTICGNQKGCSQEEGSTENGLCGSFEEQPLSRFNSLSLKNAAAEYMRQGFKVTPLRPKSKAAYQQGWNQPGYSCNPQHWEFNLADNIGMILEPSGICVLDIDNLESFKLAVTSIGLTPAEGEKPFWQTTTAGIKSGRPNSAKLVFRVPPGVKLQFHKLLWTSPAGGKECVFELRCGYVQDVLPPSIHPTSGQIYRWVGGESIQEVPADLLLLWQHWDTFEPELLKADRFYRPEETAQRTRGRPRTRQGRDIIREWCQMQNLESYLSRCGYTKVGSRYRCPDADGNPGVILTADREKFFVFNQSSPLSDGHTHNAFDLLLLHECGNDFAQALTRVREDLGISKISDRELVTAVRRILEGDTPNE